MSKKVLVFLAEGFEEMEAVICLDILRRGGLNATSVAVGDDLIVKGSRNIQIKADQKIADIHSIPDAIVLPGGIKGAGNLAASEEIKALTLNCLKEKRIIAAICASPAYVLSKFGILEGKRATCYPGCETHFGKGTIFSNDDVVIDGNILTSKGPGTAFSFALTLIAMLLGESVAEEVKNKALIA